MTGKGYQKRLKGDENLEGSYDRDVDCVFFFPPPSIYLVQPLSLMYLKPRIPEQLPGFGSNISGDIL